MTRKETLIGELETKKDLASPGYEQTSFFLRALQIFPSHLSLHEVTMPFGNDLGLSLLQILLDRQVNCMGVVSEGWIHPALGNVL